MAARLAAECRGTLRVVGLDTHGIVGAVAGLLARHGCNIIKNEQWTDRKDSLFFQRVEFNYTTANDKQACLEELHEISASFDVSSHLNWRNKRKKIGVMVSKYDHCLWELLLRHSAHELDADIEVVVSNHEDLRPVADTFQIPYHTIPITPESKMEQEKKQLDVLEGVDVVVLARYMQVLSEDFLAQFPNRIINIHHSFLPAFIGGNPHRQAWERGVKLIGATAHYTTLDLDYGPIIEQDVMHVTHRDEVSDMIRKGRMLERNVLLKALEAHLDDRVFVYKTRCVVFND